MEPLALSHVLLIGLVFSAMLVGLLGLIIPVYPGLNIIWIAALIYAIVDGFTWPAWLYFSFITLFMIVGNLADNYFINIRARKTGASWLAIGVGYIAGIVGTFIIPLLGGLLFSILGVLVVELIRKKDWKIAWVTTREMALGFGWAVVVRIGIGAIMIGIWLVWAFTNR
jgi:uncharacterized protein YqgC (DUF456 family)